jgi:hypothetical protein
MPNDAFEMLSLSNESMVRPGMMKAAYLTPSIRAIREPMAEPNTTKYSEVEITGEAMLCSNVRQVRAISKV